jgi:hypothetical protein
MHFICLLCLFLSGQPRLSRIFLVGMAITRTGEESNGRWCFLHIGKTTHVSDGWERAEENLEKDLKFAPKTHFWVNCGNEVWRMAGSAWGLHQEAERSEDSRNLHEDREFPLQMFTL